MSIEGRIAIDVNFTDTNTAGGASSVKKISLVDTTAYSTGQVAIVTGTVSTSAITIDATSPGYRNANGDLVTMAVSRVAVVGSGSGVLNCATDASLYLVSRGGKAAVSDIGSEQISSISLQTTAGTAAYTAVFYGT